MEAERLKSAETRKSLEAARAQSESLSRELEAERTQSATTVSSEKMKLSDLKRALDVGEGSMPGGAHSSSGKL